LQSGSGFHYTSDTVFDSLPWPQTPTQPQIEAVAKETVALRQLRREVMAKMTWSLRDLYRTLEEPGANPLARRPGPPRHRRPLEEHEKFITADCIRVSDYP
jgi:hypothetical protein